MKHVLIIEYVFEGNFPMIGKKTGYVNSVPILVRNIFIGSLYEMDPVTQCFVIGGKLHQPQWRELCRITWLDQKNIS